MLPAELVHLSKRHLRLSDAEIAEIAETSRQDAIERMSRFWAEGPAVGSAIGSAGR
ncbi:MAG: hypothetical protein ACYCV7_10315 [Acidimicrobiales bacterium]